MQRISLGRNAQLLTTSSYSLKISYSSLSSAPGSSPWGLLLSMEPFNSNTDRSSRFNQSRATGKRVTPPKPKVELNQALAFVNSVRAAFGYHSAGFAEFLELMNEYKCQRTGLTEVRSRVILLFKEHPELVAGFNAFLPAGHEISIPIEEDGSFLNAVGFGDAIGLVEKIKVAFKHDSGCYGSFLKVLSEYRNGQLNGCELYEEVKTILCDRPDLVEEFRLFLPDKLDPK